MALQADGKIVVAGRFSLVGDDDFGVVRFEADGDPDSLFDDDGVVTTNVESGVNDFAEDVAVTPEGLIVAAGRSAHLIGGADVAAELDAKRAIKQGTEVAAAL